MLGVGWHLSCPLVSPPLGWHNLPSLATSQCPGTELGFSRAFSQFPSTQQPLQVHRVVEFPWLLLWAVWLHFGNFFRGTLSLTPCPAPHRLLQRWKLSKPREGWDFGAANIFKSCSESRQRWFFL